MATRGPKPTPTHLRIITGNPQHRPINADEPVPEGEIDPQGPEFLSARARYHWRRAVDSAPWIKATDEAVLMSYSMAYAEVEEHEAQIRKLGHVIKMGKAGFQQNPHVWLKKNAIERLMRASAELGLTPSSRSRVKVKGKKKPSSVLGKLRTLEL